MDWRRARQLASGILLLVALVLGGVVGTTVLLGHADTTDAGVGQLSARLDAPLPVARPTVTRPGVATIPKRPVARPGEKDHAEPADD